MKTAFTTLISVFFLLAAGTFIVPAATAQAQSGGPDMGTARAEDYHGPKAAIAVADFEDKTVGRGQYRREYGRGMQDMLITELFNTDRYIVLEREKLSAVIAEQDLGASGRFRQDTTAPIGELEGAQLMVIAAVTGFDPGTAGTKGTVKGRSGLLGDRLGRLTAGVQQAHVALDLRVVDTATGRILSATNVEGKARSFDLGGSVFGSGGSGDLSTFARTPMEQAIRRAIAEAVDFVVEQTPAEFYHHR
ncbi:CsgG/HfaB family protein [Desulfurivibrio dismutans]|uniref:CsgG/HfaB family protein n=1 Tax=Desulfurivibrio dismutans TaxID=1398908 RepID=UPI0023DA3BB6|nr:CsgG/HfaB family protein [Desulfurivibrio alkaliphilus]MDF1615498.1 CsgG/HfaB family protein [Desulfurivibrio alkaliphilus]